MKHLSKSFIDRGGEFHSSIDEVIDKLAKIKAVLFDWDGVFNSGTKIGDQGSPFSEIDAMGTNMLRYALRKLNNTIPISAIITGANNPTAQKFGQREHFHEVIVNSINKRVAFDQFCSKYNLDSKEVVFFFDDILDFNVASRCGVKILIKRNSSLQLNDFVKKHNLADYFTNFSGGNFGLREGCEMLLGLLGMYDDVVKHRSEFSKDYEVYLHELRSINTTIIDNASIFHS